jgi:predicted RNase H-like nuclease (RuvC/YqgF family)
MYFAEKHQYILISREEDEIRRLQEKIRVLELENKNLLTKNTELTSENSVLLNKIRDFENDKKKYSENIGKIFTSGQMKKIMDPNCKRIRWSSDDIASAMSLRSVSKKKRIGT